MVKAFACKLALTAFAVAALASAVPARAADVDYLEGDYFEGSSITTIQVRAALPRGGQSFTIPVGETRLYAASLVVSYFFQGNPGAFLSLHRLDGSVPGPALASAGLPPNEDYPVAIATLTIPGGLAVIPGETYVLLANHTPGPQMGVPLRDDIYPGGSIYQENNGPLHPADDAYFKISFDPASAPAAPVPTMSEWAMMLLGLILAGATALYLQRRGAVS